MNDCILYVFSGRGGKLKQKFMKYVCGVDKTVKRVELSAAEKRKLQLKASDIQEDPYWKKVLDINAVICAGCAIFLHAFWA